MPAYRNDSTITYLILNTNGEHQYVEPAGTIQTYRQLDLAGMTKTAEAPYYNPSPTDGVHDVTSTGPGDDKEIALHDKTKEVEIWNESDADITVFLIATANTPGLKLLAHSIRNIANLENMADKICLQFSGAVTSGQCYLTELKG